MTTYIAKTRKARDDDIDWGTSTDQVGAIDMPIDDQATYNVNDLFKRTYGPTIYPADILSKGPWVDVRAFGASGSAQQTTGSVESGSTTLTLTDAKDFQNGYGIRINGAGASGADLVTSVSSGGGTTTLTLADAASTTVTDATVDHDDSSAINAALLYAKANDIGPVGLAAGNTYVVSLPIVLPQQDENGEAGRYNPGLIGIGGMAKIKTSTAINAITTYDVTGQPDFFTYGIRLENLWIDGNDVGTNGIVLWRGANVVQLRNVYVRDFTNDGIQLKRCVTCNLENVTSISNDNAGLFSYGGTTLNMDSCYFNYNKYGYHNGECTESSASTDGISAVNTVFENNSTNNLRITGGPSEGVFYRCWFETTGTTTDVHILVDNSDSTSANVRGLLFDHCQIDDTATTTFTLEDCNYVTFQCIGGGKTTGTAGTIAASANYTRIIQPIGANTLRPDRITNNSSTTWWEAYDVPKHASGSPSNGPHWQAGQDDYVLIKEGNSFRIVRATMTNSIFQTRQSTAGALGAHNWFNLLANGKMEWGSGSAALDTNLYRNGADQLKTDDSLTLADQQNVASAAELTLPTDGNIFAITGTTDITSIAAASTINGRVVILRFAGALTFTDGNNLKIAGNFVTTGNDTITMYSDGTNWYEIARSVN